MLLSSRRYSLAEFYTIFASVIFGAQATTKLFGFAYSKSHLRKKTRRSYSLPGFTKGKFAANHVLGVQITQKVRDLSTAVPEDSQKGFAISFRDVHFRYPTRIAQVFCGLSFDVSGGEVFQILCRD
jgi:ABC-type multidrug transport system fused ATPase/permease subunit